jgi:hypothetical protein
VTGGESTLAGNEVMNRLIKEIPRKWNERFSSSSFERRVSFVSVVYVPWVTAGASPLNK